LCQKNKLSKAYLAKTTVTINNKSDAGYEQQNPLNKMLRSLLNELV
jgi:hypothetical protein